jgi:hypothetical protein
VALREVRHEAEEGGQYEVMLIREEGLMPFPPERGRKADGLKHSEVERSQCLASTARLGEARSKLPCQGSV